MRGTLTQTTARLRRSNDWLKLAWMSALFVVLSGQAFAGGLEGPDPKDFARPMDPQAPAFAFNPTTSDKIAAGRRLFFDPRMSASNTTACASCHLEAHGWTDRARFSTNDLGKPMTRRTQTLLGVGWVPKLGWDGGVDALEAFVLAPIARAPEMAQDLDGLVDELNTAGDYAPFMKAAFGVDDVSITRISQSLAAFMRALVPPETPFDRWAQGDETAISEGAKHGFRLFAGKAGCAACHSGWRMTDDAFHDIGLQIGDDLGRAEHIPNDPAMRYAFKTPTLRGVAARAPYMHDGSLLDLGAVIDHYGDMPPQERAISPLVQPLALNAQEKLNVVDFLRSLSADTQ